MGTVSTSPSATAAAQDGGFWHGDGLVGTATDARSPLDQQRDAGDGRCGAQHSALAGGYAHQFLLCTWSGSDAHGPVDRIRQETAIQRVRRGQWRDHRVWRQEASSPCPAGSGHELSPFGEARKLREALGVEPASIDMGSVSDWSGSLPSREIELSNGLKTDWSGTVQSTVPWLKVAPTETTCPAGASVTLQVRLTKRGARLRPRTYLAADALIIEGDGQTLKVAAQMTVE